MKTNAIIKFKNQHLSYLRSKLLSDLSNESYALLIGKAQTIDGTVIVTIHDVRFPDQSEYLSNTVVSLKIDGQFAGTVLEEIDSRFDVDTLIEVHTHPFTKERVHFSSVDNNDERMFSKWLMRHYENINYGSIVFSQEEYSARLWSVKGLYYNTEMDALIKTQTYGENIKCTNIQEDTHIELEELEEIYNRSILALGKSNIHALMNNQLVTIVGVGGIGSVIAENLVHMGFQNINLVDHDIAELSNLNRVVGLTYKSAVEQNYKVDVVKNHILKINPKLNVNAFHEKVSEKKIESVIAMSDWVILATDNHYSRFETQELCFKYYVPFISVGVNITVDNNLIEDISGEVITVRMGDGFCLKCLNRLKPNEIAKELNPDQNVKDGLVNKGYVTGLDVKEPAVKTLNSIMGALLVDILVNNYTENQVGHPIVVYENNRVPRIYYDQESMENKNRICNVCDL